MTPERILLIGLLLSQIVMFWLLRQLPDLIAGEVRSAVRRALNGPGKP